MTTPHLSPDEALATLIAGNQRYVNGIAEHPRQTSEWRMQVLSTPRPAAAILSCADSRVPPEICFDQGIGDLFVIRTAGNITDDVVLGTLEFGITVFKIPLIVVMGHTLCGAVMATVAGDQVSGHIGSVVETIHPAVEASKREPGDPVLNATIMNVRLMVEKIATCQPILSEMVEMGKVKVAGALYHLDSGMVELL